MLTTGRSICSSCPTVYYAVPTGGGRHSWTSGSARSSAGLARQQSQEGCLPPVLPDEVLFSDRGRPAFPVSGTSGPRLTAPARPAAGSIRDIPCGVLAVSQQALVGGKPLVTTTADARLP